MIAKFAPIIAETTAILGSAFAAMVAAVMAAEPSTTVIVHEGNTTIVHQIVIMDDERMRLTCIIGALAGGVLSSILFAGKDPSAKSLAGKVFASTGLGVVATPAFFHYMGWTPTTDTLLFASAFVALVGVGVVKTAVPLWQKYIVSKVSPPSIP